LAEIQLISSNPWPRRLVTIGIGIALLIGLLTAAKYWVDIPLISELLRNDHEDPESMKIKFEIDKENVKRSRSVKKAIKRYDDAVNENNDALEELLK